MHDVSTYLSNQMHTSLGFEANASLNQVVAIGCRVQQNYFLVAPRVNHYYSIVAQARLPAFIIILADIRPGPLLRH